MTNPDITQYTAAELMAMRAQINEEELDAKQKTALRTLDALITRKTAEEAISAHESASEFRRKATHLDAKAKTLFPELKDRETDFSKRVDSYLEEMGNADRDPSALLNAAWMVADELGVEPATTKVSPKEMKVGGAGKGGGGEPADDDFLARTKGVAAMFEGMGLDMSKDEVKESVIKNAELIREDLNAESN